MYIPVLHLFIRGSRIASLSNIPSVMYLILVFSEVTSSNLTQYPTYNTHREDDSTQPTIHTERMTREGLRHLTQYLTYNTHKEDDKGRAKMWGTTTPQC